MTLTEKQISQIVGRILSEVREYYAGDGIDVLAASLASAIISANATGLFDKRDLHAFMADLEMRIEKTLKVLDVPKRSSDILMRRAT